jgi:hypothetical protein
MSGGNEAFNDHEDDRDIEEDECRVCRGPAEEGYVVICSVIDI